MLAETQKRFITDPVLHSAVIRGRQCGMLDAEIYERLVNILLENREQWLRDCITQITESVERIFPLPNDQAQF